VRYLLSDWLKEIFLASKRGEAQIRNAPYNQNPVRSFIPSGAPVFLNARSEFGETERHGARSASERHPARYAGWIARGARRFHLLGVGPIAYFALIVQLSRMLLNRPHLCIRKAARSTAEAQARLWACQIAAVIKKLFPGMVIATLACAQAEGQESAPVDVRRMADWVVASADNRDLPFVIVDKKAAEVLVFDRQGQILGAAAALLGLAVGDDSAPDVGNKPLSAIPPRDRTTPAGRFVASLGYNMGKESTLWVSHKDNIALHRVITGRPKDHRLQRLATPTPLDNRITFGCINVPVDFFERTVLPTFKSTQGIVYILPEIKATRDVFPNYYDVDG
jgi:hypothetical protein